MNKIEIKNIRLAEKPEKQMKKLLIICSLFLFSFSYNANAQSGSLIGSSFAQSNKNSNVNKSASGAEKIKQLKTVYMVKELDIQQKEYTEFWNAYSRYEQELHQLWLNKGKNRKEFEKGSKQLQKGYVPVFQKILGSEERANKVYTTDADFRQMLRKELKDRRD